MMVYRISIEEIINTELHITSTFHNKFVSHGLVKRIQLQLSSIFGYILTEKL